MSRKVVKKEINKKNILIVLVILVVGISIGVGAYYIKNKTSKNNFNQEEKIKISPYSLDEIYEIIENPQRFKEQNKIEFESEKTDQSLGYVLIHFYDYFSKTTPFKVATKVERDGLEVTKVLETKYISYYEFMDHMDKVYKSEKENDEKSKELGQYLIFDYRSEAEYFIYTKYANL